MALTCGAGCVRPRLWWPGHDPHPHSAPPRPSPCSLSSGRVAETAFELPVCTVVSDGAWEGPEGGRVGEN